MRTIRISSAQKTTTSTAKLLLSTGEASRSSAGLKTATDSANLVTATELMNADQIHYDRVTTDSKLFAHTRWDAIPTIAGLFHLV